MKEFARIQFLEGTYKDFLENFENIPVGSICYCKDKQKIFVITDDPKIILQEENEEGGKVYDNEE